MWTICYNLLGCYKLTLPLRIVHTLCMRDSCVEQNRTDESKIISIVIATFNRPRQIEDCLNALTRLEFDHSRWEVIIVDDGGKIDLLSIVNKFVAKLPVRLIRQEHCGPARARNYGAQQAVGRYIAFTDDDCAPEPSWLSELVVELERASESLIGGRTENGLGTDLYAATNQLLIDYLYEYYLVSRPTRAFFTSNNLACSARLFSLLGGFDSRFPKAAAEDRDFSCRWLESGKTLQFAPEARIKHLHSLNAAKFLRLHFNYGRGAFIYHRLRSKRTGEGLRPEPFKFYVDLLAYPLAQVGLPKRRRISLLLAISQLANTLGFFYQSILNNWIKIELNPHLKAADKPLAFVLSGPPTR